MTAILDRKIPFFTPVMSDIYPLTKIVDSYLWFGGEVAEVVIPEQITGDSTAVRPVDGETNMVATVLKIATMILSLGILPLLAIAMKVIMRSSHSFHWVARQEQAHNRNRIPQLPEPPPLQREIPVAIAPPVPVQIPLHPNLSTIKELLERKAALDLFNDEQNPELIAAQADLDVQLNSFDWLTVGEIKEYYAESRMLVDAEFVGPDDILEHYGQVARPAEDLNLLHGLALILRLEILQKLEIEQIEDRNARNADALIREEQDREYEEALRIDSAAAHLAPIPEEAVEPGEPVVIEAPVIVLTPEERRQARLAAVTARLALQINSH